MLGDPLGSTPKNDSLRPIETNLNPKYKPEIFPSASETPGLLGGPFWVLSEVCSILWAACPKAHGPGSLAPRAVAMRILAPLQGLDGWRLCQSSTEHPCGSPAALALPMCSNTISNRTLPHPQQPACLPFLLPDHGTDIHAGVRCSYTASWAALHWTLLQLPWEGSFLVSTFPSFPSNLLIPC